MVANITLTHCTTFWERKSSSFTVVGVPVDQRFVLRIGNQVVGVENRGFGKVRLPAGDTVSPKVEKEVIQ